MNNYSPEKTSFQDFLIAFLCSARSSKRFFQILNERACKKRSRNSTQGTLNRLKKKGFITNNKNGWSITENGKSYYEKKLLLSPLISPFPKNSPKNILFAFDIPENNRHLRNWLRQQLKIYGYKMVQQSLWQGPGPIPKEFKERVRKLDIVKNIKLFNLSTKSKID